MPKSARRKRFGIYYTPADFTTFIVQETLGRVIDDRLAKTAAAHGIAPDDPSSQADPAQRARYGQACLQTLREVKVCDPACGSGAFLIQAYDLLEQRYLDIIDDLSDSDPSAAETLSDGVGDMILGENLYGVDVSAEAVEITQLALWIRSARRGKTLADLSRNIICANSLVTDPSVDARAIDWRGGFPQVFSRENPGFDCVIGNPPWERMKLQEREFFAFSAPDIAEAVSAAERRSLLANLEKRHPDLFARYREARARADATLAHVRSSGEFPLTAKGDINTYALFAELARKIVAPMGRVGILVPSGIASDKTTKDFFAELMKDRALVSLYDFENREGLFVDLHRSFKFCTLIFSGSDVKGTTADFVFFAHEMRDLADSTRHVSLSAKDLALLNPNTRTCPIFRSRRDAELTNAIYRKVPVLLEKARGDAGNPWGIRFVRMFDQTNDAELFHTSERLMKMGCKLKGNRWTRGKKTYLPLYEAKMIQAYDHRAASVVIDVKNWMRQGQAEPTSLVCHQNPDFLPQPRWWVEESRVDEVLEAARSSAYLCFKDVTSPTNQRTMIAALVPRAGIVNSAPLLLTSNHVAPRRLCCLLANLNSFVLDFVARQKVGNVHLNFFIVEQLPVLPPDAYADRCAWNARQRLEKWISDRVLKLTCTAADMRPLAEACGMSPPVHKWKPAERAELSAELDAAYFLLYGVKRRDAEYILSTFTGTRRRDESEIGEYRTAHLILDAFDRLSQT
jgi:hypothetical protein